MIVYENEPHDNFLLYIWLQILANLQSSIKIIKMNITVIVVVLLVTLLDNNFARQKTLFFLKLFVFEL